MLGGTRENGRNRERGTTARETKREKGQKRSRASYGFTGGSKQIIIPRSDQRFIANLDSRVMHRKICIQSRFPSRLVHVVKSPNRQTCCEPVTRTAPRVGAGQLATASFRVNGTHAIPKKEVAFISFGIKFRLNPFTFLQCTAFHCKYFVCRTLWPVMNSVPNKLNN